MEITILKIDQIKPYVNNPRDNKKAIKLVAESISEFGFRVPIIVDKNNVIVCGHARYSAALSLNLQEVPCIVADDLSDEEIKAFRLIDNKCSDASVPIQELEAAELLGIPTIDMTRWKFTLKDPTEAEEDNYEAPADLEPKTKLGQVWQLGKHRLMCGDSTSPEDVQILLGGVQWIWCSLIHHITQVCRKRKAEILQPG